MTTLRPHRPEDAAALFAVFLSAVRGTAPTYYTEEQARAWAPDNYDREQWSGRMAGINPFVVEDDGASETERLVVAYADVQADGYIDHFFVSAPYARRGIGNQLMDAIHHRAAEQAMPRLYSNVSHAARGFFERWGFVVIAKQTFERHGVEMSNHAMEKLLV